MLLCSFIAVDLTNSSAAQNHVVFQPTTERAKYGMSDIERLLQFSFEVCFDSFNTVYRSLLCEQSYKKTYEA